MSLMKTPPVFSNKRSYERYRAELTAWTEVTSIKKESWARIIALHMPDSEAEGDIRGKIFESLGDKLAGEAGYDKLLKWLDKHFKQDNDIIMIDRIKQFMKFVKGPDMSITEFLAGFDTAYNTAVKKGLDRLPQPYLMYMIIENAGLTDQETKFILSDVDKTKTDTLYEQTRVSMKKYLIGLNGETEDGSGVKLKTDSSVMFLNSKGKYVRPQAGTWRPNVPQYIPSNPIRSAHAGFTQRFNSNTYRGARPKIPIVVPRNPIKDGKQMLCDICGSYTHLQVKCPHNPNNGIYIADNIESHTDGDVYSEYTDGAHYGASDVLENSHASNFSSLCHSSSSEEQNQYNDQYNQSIQYNTIQYNTNTIQYNTIQYQCNTIQYQSIQR